MNRILIFALISFALLACSHSAPSVFSSNPAASRLDSFRQLFVAYQKSAGGGLGQVAVFRNTASGNMAPISVLAGPDTGLLHSDSVAFDSSGHMWVANGAPSDTSASLTIYNVGASGDTPPTVTISGDRTHLYAPTGIAIVGSFVYVTSTRNRAHGGSFCNCVLAFRTFQKGDAAPVAVISGPETRITQPRGIFVNPSSRIWVADSDDEILAFSSHANGNVAPVIDINGPNTQLNGDEAVVENASREVFVAQQSSYVVFGPGATGDATPIANVTGTETDLIGTAEGIAIQGSDVYVSFWNDCTCSDGVKTFPQTANGNVPPIRDLKGSRTGFHRFMLKNVSL